MRAGMRELMQEWAVVRVVLCLVVLVVGFEVTPQACLCFGLGLMMALEFPAWAPRLWVQVQIPGTPHLPANEALGFRARFVTAQIMAQFEAFRVSGHALWVLVLALSGVAQLRHLSGE